MNARSQERVFEDRIEAGRALAAQLARYAGRGDVIVLGLPRGGVPVAEQVAQILGAPLDVFLVRKLGVPGHEEHAMGALASGGVTEVDGDLVRTLGISAAAVRATVRREQAELERRERVYRAGRAPVDVRGRTVIVVDDGLATGATMHAAVSALRMAQPARIVVAVPVASVDACSELARHADECVCVSTPEPFRAVGPWYREFDATEDSEVLACLERAQARERRAAARRSAS